MSDSPAKERKTKVMWTEADTDMFIPAAIDAWLNDEENIWWYISVAQQALTPERRRVITGKAQIHPKIKAKFMEARHKLLESMEVPVPVNLETIKTVEQPREEVLQSITTEELLVLLAKHMAPIVQLVPGFLQGASLSASVVRPSAQRPPPLQASPIATMPHKPRVLLFGFLPGQDQTLKEKAKAFDLELVFRKNDGGKHDPPPTCNWCIFMNKVGHSSTKKLKQFGKKLFKVEGTEGALSVLADIHAQTKAGVR